MPKLRHQVFSCIFAAYFRNTFLEKHLWRAAFAKKKNIGKYHRNIILNTTAIKPKKVLGLCINSEIFSRNSL